MRTKIGLLLIVIVYIFSFLQFEEWDNTIIHGGDSWGYYVYLPAAFIHHDLDNLEESFKARTKHGSHQPISFKNKLRIEEAMETDDGALVIKYTNGVAFCNLPFFLLGHVTALMTDYESDGYSKPYRFFILLGTLIYAIIGLWLTGKTLQRFLPDKVVVWVLIAVGLASNLFFFSVAHGGMAHPYLFFFWSLLLYATIRWYKRPNLSWAVLIGACCGMIVLLRPTDVLCVLIPLVYGITSIERRQQLSKHLPHLAYAALAAFVVNIPQLLYWYHQTGHWLVYSYEGETFDFTSPKIKDGLFSFRNGWFAYTPVMILAISGLFIKVREQAFHLVTTLVLGLTIYIALSWWCPNYPNGFGLRPMIDIYGLLAIPIGFSLQAAFKRTWSKWLLIVFIGLCVSSNIWLSWKNKNGSMFSEYATFQFVYHTFFKTSLSYRDVVMYDINEYQPKENEIEKISNIASYDCGDKNDHVCQITEGNSTEALIFLVDTIDFHPDDYIRVSCSTKLVGNSASIYGGRQLVGSFRNAKGKPYKWRSVRLENKVKQDKKDYSLWNGDVEYWGEVWYYIKPPKEHPEGAYFTLSALNPNMPNGYVDDLRIDLYRMKK